MTTEEKPNQSISFAAVLQQQFEQSFAASQINLARLQAENKYLKLIIEQMQAQINDLTAKPETPENEKENIENAG